MRFSRGMSTPAIRATSLLTLTLLVARVRLADDAYNSGPANDLALLTDWFDARANFHCVLSRSLERELFVAIGDASASHVVGRDLYLDLVAGKNTNAVHAHLSRTVREDGVAVL